jgi:hypothetical protein
VSNVQHHPLIFTFRDTISGDGFLGGVTISGRALMIQEDDGKWWMYGVRPGSIAATGTTPPEAFLDFKNRYMETLFDIAEESRTYEAFKAEVERYFYEEDREEEQRWEAALREIRTKNVDPPAPFADLPRQTPEERPAQITVERLDEPKTRFRPSDNVRDTYAYPAAQAA